MKRMRIGIISLLAASLAGFVLCCALGGAMFSLPDLLSAVRARDAATPASRILFGIRIPRALLSYLVGAGLSVSGVCMQGVFKNPMADPHILGVSSGAAFGASLMMIAKQSALISVGAFVGGTAAVLLVMSISRVKGRTNTVSLLLAGVAVATFLSAILTGLLTLNHDKMESVYMWVMGSFMAASWSKIWIMLSVLAVGFTVVRFFARDLNALMTGEEEARSLGVNVGRTRIAVLGVSTLITATAVSFTGIIGFVGLMVPHAVRFITGPDHRRTLPVSLLAGGFYLMLMDALARTAFVPIEMPVGVLTALIGGPFFLYLLKRAKM